MKVERAVGLLSVSLIIVSTIAYLLNNPHYGFILAVAIPLAIVSVYLEVRQKRTKLLTPIVMLMLFAVCMSSVAEVHATVYQAHGNVGWIYPDGDAWAMVDTDADELCFKWSFSDYILLPYVGLWFVGSAEISDSNGQIWIKAPIQNAEEIWLNYTGERVWITFTVHVTYILASPVPAFLCVEITLTFYIGIPPTSGGGGNIPCPTLFVWNGENYVDYGVIDIHNPNGEDVIREAQ